MFLALMVVGAAPQLVRDLNLQPATTPQPGSNTQPTDPVSLRAIGDTAFLVASGSGGTELWKSNGTVEGTTMVKDVYPGEEGSALGRLTVVGDTLYFTAADGVHGQELWTRDGTGASTVMVVDLAPGVWSS